MSKYTLLIGTFILSLIVAFIAPDAFADYPRPWQLGLQEAASPVMEKLNALHNMVLVIITFVSLFVLSLLLYVIVKFNHKANPVPSKTSHNTLLEVIWTGIPVIILIVIAIPTFRILYYMDKTEDAEMTLKAIGYQWYWGYEYPDENLAFESYIIKDEDIRKDLGQKRLLEVDNRVVLPVDTNIRLLFTASDVIHAWAVPALGVKMDAVPGRTNESWVRINEPGVYYGQCSELCGVYHGFMPIVVEAVSKEDYAKWVERSKRKFSTLEDNSTANLASAK